MLAEKLPDLPTAQAREQLLAIDSQVTLDQTQVHLSLCTERLSQLLGAAPTTDAPGAGAESETRYRLPIPARVARQGRGYRLIIRNGVEDDASNIKRVQRLLATAYHYRQLLLAGDGQTIRALATSVGVTPSYFTRVVRLSFLPPEFVESIFRGGQAAGSIQGLEQLKSASIDPSWYPAP